MHTPLPTPPYPPGLAVAPLVPQEVSGHARGMPLLLWLRFMTQTWVHSRLRGEKTLTRCGGIHARRPVLSASHKGTHFHPEMNMQSPCGQCFCPEKPARDLAPSYCWTLVIPAVSP